VAIVSRMLRSMHSSGDPRLFESPRDNDGNVIHCSRNLPIKLYTTLQAKDVLGVFTLETFSVSTAVVALSVYSASSRGTGALGARLQEIRV
jgi:hypothetical protein